MDEPAHPNVTTLRDMKITVTGSAESRHAPSRATLPIVVTAEAPNVRTATQWAEQTSHAVSSAIAQHETAGAVENWTRNPLTLSSHRPWTNDGTPGEPLYTAHVAYRITFTDFTALASLLEAVAGTEHVQLQDVAWELSEPQLQEAIDTVRVKAVKNAYDKALTYARAAGIESIAYEEIADIGLMSDSGAGFEGKMLIRSAAPIHSDTAFEARPEDVVVSASVNVRFAAK